MRRAKTLQIVATESDSGKTQILSGLAYIFRRFSPLPFKSQNMSLNAYVGFDNGEMAFAQAYQAMVGGRAPLTSSNPVLLKPVGRNRTEVIFRGKSLGIFDTQQYWLELKPKLKSKVFSLFEELLEENEFILVEGAGSCTEVNLKRYDFSNLSLSTRFDIPFILVTDIERGGVFAKVIGSWELMNKRERELLLGVIINKMAGDPELLKDGIRFIEKKITKRILGVIPYEATISLPEEDSMGVTRPRRRATSKNVETRTSRVSIKVIATNYISNFFDFYPLELDSKYNDGIEVSFARTPAELDGADAVIIPGSRNVFHDITFMRESGLSDKVLELVRREKYIIGICGGYEMMFENIKDTFGIEGRGNISGLGLISGTVRFQKEKKVFWEDLYIESPWFCGKIRGFNIRHGDSDLKFFHRKNIFGTFLHGIFWNDEFREGLYSFFGVDYKNKFSTTFKKEIENWSKMISDNVELDFIRKELGLYDV